MKIWIRLGKQLTGVLLLLIVIREWRDGYFDELKDYGRSLKPSTYLRTFVLLALLVIGALFVDVRAQSLVLSLQNPFLEAVNQFGRHFGKHLWPYLGGFYVVGIFARRKDFCHIAFGMILSTMLTGLASGILKMTFLRARPDMGLGVFSFFHLDGLLKDLNSFQSFPSGDVAIAAGAFSYLFYSLKNSRFGWAVLFIPLTTMLSRMMHNDHWFSDALCSFGLSLILGHLVWNFKKTVFLAPGKA